MPTERVDPAEPVDPFADRVTFDPVERQIREAMERGEFDHLPGAGKPIADLDAGYDPAWWVRRWLERSRLEDAVHEVRRTIDRELPFLRVERDRERVTRRMAEINEMIAAVNEALPEGERIAPIAG